MHSIRPAILLTALVALQPAASVGPARADRPDGGAADAPVSTTTAAAPAALPAVALPAAPEARPLVGGFVEAVSTIDNLLLHYYRDATPELHALFDDLLAALPPEVEVTVAVPGPADVDAWTFAMPPARTGLPAWVTTGVDLTAWARDRLIALRPDDRTGYVLVTPDVSDIGPDHSGDLRVAEALGGLEGEFWVHEPSQMTFEGGNILFAHDTVLIGWNDVFANTAIGRGEDTDEESYVSDDADRDAAARNDEIEPFVRTFRSPVLAIGREDRPHEHLDMFLTVVGPRTVLLGDPELGARYLLRLEALRLDEGILPTFDVWPLEAQRQMVSRYESIRRELTDAGFEVRRIPILHGLDGNVITWNNALVENRNGERRAYVPVYDIPYLDRLALRTYESVGCRAFPIRATKLAEIGGTVRCATNVIGWHTAPRPAH